MSEPPTEKPRGWYALHLLWTVPLAIGISFVPIAMSGFAICGLACFGPGDMHYDRVPVAVGLCALAGLLMFAAVQLLPWTKHAQTRLLVSIPAGLLWTGFGLLTALQVTVWGFRPWLG